MKLLGSLVPEEPRLARKLLEPLATIIQVCRRVGYFTRAFITWHRPRLRADQDEFVSRSGQQIFF